MRCNPKPARGFTLVELLVSMAVLTVLVMMLVTMTTQTNQLWRRASAKVEQFREARNAFESMTTRLAQATLNTYFDYDSPTSPTKYGRKSELRFIAGPAKDLIGGTYEDRTRLTHSVFFQAPLGEVEIAKYNGFENLLTTTGYFIEYGEDSVRPEFLKGIIPDRYRHRLMEIIQPSEKNSIYIRTKNRAATYTGREWFSDSANAASATRPARVAAENIIALVIMPRLGREDETEVNAGAADPDFSPLAPKYLYDSSPAASATSKDARLNPVAQLPPVLQVTMVALDETAINRLNLKADTADPFGVETLFEDTRKYSKDLLMAADASSSLEAKLVKKGINYRIFTSNVIIRGAKWSREQTN